MRDIECIKQDQNGVKETQSKILGRIEVLEKRRNSTKEVITDLVRKLDLIEGQVKILGKRDRRSNGSGCMSKRAKISQYRSVEELFKENKLHIARVNDLKSYLRKMKKQRVVVKGKRITLVGSKKVLINRVRKILESLVEKERECQEKKLSSQSDVLNARREISRRAR